MSDATTGANGMKKIALALMAIGGVLSLIALFTDTDRFGFGYLWGYTFVWAIALGGLFFVALHHLTRAVWSVVFRRVAEMVAAPIGVLVILFIPILLFMYLSDSFSLFPWANAEKVAGDHILESKEAYLNTTFFLVRGLFFIGLWWAFMRFFVRGSVSQDGGNAGDTATRKMQKWAGPFIILFALTVTFASFDWLMSLEPHWFSTIFGVYIFSGMVLSALSVLTLVAIKLRSQGRLGKDIVKPEHFYSLGLLLFAFTVFWAYICFSQFMLIWYANIPEETVYFAHRAHHGWLEVSIALVALRFVLPFFLLLSRYAKMNPRRLVLVSILCLVGQLVDLYWLIMPQFHREAPQFGWQEVGPLLLLSGIMIFFMARFLARHPTLPEGDPLFEKSCAFHL